MADGFRPFGVDGLTTSRLDGNNNPITSDQLVPEFKPFDAAGNPTEFKPIDRQGFLGAKMGAPNPDEFDFRVTSYMDPYEVRAQRQTSASKWGNASVKMLGLTGTTLVDNTLGTVVGLGNGVAEMARGGNFGEGFINNPVSAALYDFTKKMEKEFPNYYTRKEQHSPWYNNLGTANFWADTILKNTGFALGAYLSGMGISSGMAALTSGMTKKAAKNIAGRMAKQLGKTEDEVLKMMKAGEMPTDQILKELSKDASLLKGINTANQITSSTLGAVGESRIEALHTYHDTLDRIKRENPGMSAEEAQNQAVSAANMVFGLDMVTLSLGNFAQFRNAFSRGYEVNKRSMNAIQRSADDRLYKATGGRLEKAKNIAGIIKNPIYEGLEEQQQFFNTKFSEKFYELQNDPEARDYISNSIDAFIYGFSESYGSLDSYDNFFAGFVTGGLGMPGVTTKDGKTQFQMQGGVFEGVRDYQERNKNTDTAIKKLNEFMEDPDFQKRLAFLTRDVSLERTKNVALANEDLFNFKNAEDDQFLNMVLAFADAGKIDDLKADIQGLAAIKPEDYRKMMSVKVDQLPESIKSELADDVKEYDIFTGVEDSKIKDMLSTRATMMKEDIDKVLKIRDDLEIKAGNKINRALIPNLVHYAYTIERGQKRLEEIKSNVLQELSQTFTTPIQTEAPKDVYGFVLEDGKRTLRILKEGETSIAKESLTEEQQKELKEKQAEADKLKKAQILSKREKPDTKGTSLFNFSILETGDESMFMEAFDNFAKENPFAADKVRDDVMDAVKMSQRLRTFTELYTETYRNNQSPEIKQRTFAESLARLEEYKKAKSLKSFTVGSIVEFTDPKNGRKKSYEIFSYDSKGGKTTFTLNEYVEGVGRDVTKKKKVSLEDLMGKDFKLVDNKKGIERFTIDFNEVNTYKLETKQAKQYGYILDKKGQRKLVIITEADRKEGRVIKAKDLTAEEKKLMDKKNAKEPLVFRNLTGRAEKLLNRYFDVSLRDRLEKAFKVINELAPNQNDAPLQAQLERIAGLFYTRVEGKGDLGYLANMYTFSALDEIWSRLDGINNIYIREALRDKIIERKDHIKQMKEELIKDYGMALDRLWSELEARDRGLAATSDQFAQNISEFENQLKEMSLQKITDSSSLAVAKRKLTTATKRFQEALDKGDSELAAKILPNLIKYESRINSLKQGIQDLEESVQGIRNSIEEEKTQLKETKEDLAKYERAINRLEEYRADLDKDVKYYTLEEVFEMIEDMLPESIFVEEFEKRVYDFPNVGLSDQEKVDYLTREAQRAEAESEELTNLRVAAEEAEDAVKTEESIQKNVGTTPEGADRIRQLKRKAEDARQAYLELLEEEKPYYLNDAVNGRNETARSVEAGIYKSAGLSYSDPSSVGIFPPTDAAQGSTPQAMRDELKKADLKDENGKPLDVDALSEAMLEQEYIRLQRRQFAGLGKQGFTTLYRSTGKFKETELTAEEVYAQKVEGIRALGIPIDDAISLEDMRALKDSIDSEIKEREIAIKMMEEILDDVQGVIDTVKENLAALDAAEPGSAAKADILNKTLNQFETQRKKLITRMVQVGTGLRNERAKREALMELEHRKELMDFLEVMKVARVKTAKEKAKKDTSKKSEDNDPTAETDAPTTIEKAGSTASPGQVEELGKDGEDSIKAAHSESAKPSYWEIFNRSAGSHMPGGDPNPITSERRFHNWLQFNGDVAKDYKVELFQAGDRYAIPEDAIFSEDPDNQIFGAVITYDEDNKKKYVNADGTFSDTFDSSKALFFNMRTERLERSEEYGEPYREPTKAEIASEFGIAVEELTDTQFKDYKDREIESLKENYKAKREGWKRQINNPEKENPVLNISEVSQGIPQETETVAPSTVQEFFGHNDVTIYVSTGDSFEVPGTGRVVKTTPGHTIAVDNKTKNFVRLRPRQLADEEINTVVNIFKTYAKRHRRNEGDGNIIRLDDAHILRDAKNKPIDPAEANLFSVLSDIVWWQGNNLNYKNEPINTNDDTRFHFVAKSGVPGGKIRIGKDEFAFLGITKDKDGKEVFQLNPEVEDAIRSFLQSRYRQITSRRFNSKNKNKKYTHVISLKNENGMLMPNDTKEYDTYKDYVISDRSYGERPIAEVRMPKVDKPTTVEGMENAPIFYANRKLVFDYDLRSYRNEQKKKNQEESKKQAANSAKKAKDTKKKAKKQDKPAPKTQPNENPDVFTGDVGDPFGMFGGEFMDDINNGNLENTSVISKEDLTGKSKDTPSKARGKQRKIDDAVFSGYENTDEMEKWFKSKFPSSVEFKRTKRLVNGNSWGEFVDGIVTVVENAAEGTTFHEAFHVVMTEFLSPAEYKAVIEEFLQRPNAEQLIAEKAKAYSDYTREGIIEEILADEFAEYELSGGTMKIPAPAQKSFFEKLLNWIKNLFGMGAPSIHEVYDKLSSGYYANAKPNGKSKAGIGGKQRRFENESSPLTNEFVAVINRKFFAFANDDFRAEFDSYISGDLTKAGVLDKIYNAVRDDLQEVRSDMQSDIDNKVEGYEIVQRQLNNLNAFLDKWDSNEAYTDEMDKLRYSFKEFHRTQVLSRYDVFTELDLDEIKDEESKDSGSNTWAFNSMTRSAIESSSRRLRLFLAGLPDTYKGEYYTYGKVSEDFGTTKAMPFGKAFAIYSNLLANTRSIAEAYQRIRANIETTPGADFLIKELRLDKLFRNEPLTNSELQLINDFAQSFNLQKMDYLMTAVGSKGSGAVMNASQESQKTRLIRDFRNNERIIATLGTSPYITVDPNTDRVKYTGETPVSDLRGTAAEVDAKKRAVYRAVGIEFTDEVWNALPQDSEAKLLQNVETILNKMRRQELSIYEKESRMSVQLGLLVDDIVKVDPDKTENSHLNLDGNVVYDNILHNYMSFISNGINRVETRDQLLQEYPFLKSAYLANSKMLKLGGILFDENGNKVSNKKLSIVLGEGARTDNRSVKKEFSKMTASEKFKFVLDMSIKNKFMMIRAGSNSNERFISFADEPIATTKSATSVGGVVMDKFVSDMLNYAVDELAYIAEVRSMSKQYTFSEKFKDADTAIQSSPVLSIIAKDNEIAKVLRNLINTRNSSKEMLDGIDIKLFNESQVDLMLRAEKLIDEAVDLEADKLAQKAIKLGLVIPSGSTKLNNLGVPSVDNNGVIIEKESFSTYGSLVDAMRRHATNFMVSQLEQQKLFAGHPAQYVKLDKDTGLLSVDNMIKRMSGMVGPKKASVIDSAWWRNAERLYPALGGVKRLYMDKDGNINETLTAESKPVLKTLILQDIEAQNMGLAEIFADYADMNEADAQGYIHLDTYRDLLLTNGVWNFGLEKLYQWEMAGRKPVTFKWNGELTTVRSEGDLMNEAGKMVSFNPLKPQYFGPLAELGYTTSMYKLSVMPLIPSVIGETNLNKLNNFMTLNNTGMIVYQSGNKVGTAANEDGSLTNFYNENGNVGLNTTRRDYNLPYQHIYYEFFGVQVSTGNTRKDSTSYGSQVHKQIMYEVHDGTGYKDMSFPELGLNEASSVNTEKVMNRYLDLVGSRIRMGAASLRRRLGMVQRPDGKLEIEDVNKTLELLKALVAERDLPTEYIKAFDSLKVDGKITEMGITVLPARSDIERALFAIADKMTIKSKMKGAGLIQVASTGWEQVGVSRTYKDGKLDASKLKFYQNEKGRVTRMQVYVPHYFKEILGDINDNVIVDDRLKKLLGFRIPTSGLNSIDAIEIAGFLPAHAGDMIVLPTEIVAKAGSDYDVDKLTVYYPHYTTSRTADGKTELRYLEFYDENEIRTDPNKYNELKNRVRDQIISDDPILRKKIDSIKGEYDTKYIEDLKAQKREVYSDFMKADAVKDFLEQFNLDPNRTNKKRLEQRYRGMRRTLLLMNRMRKDLLNKDGEAKLATTSDLFLLSVEDPTLVALNFNEDMSNDAALDALDRLISTADAVNKELENYIEGDPAAERQAIQMEIDVISEQMNKRISELVNPEVDAAFQKMDIFEKNGKKAVENQINRTMQGIVLSPENYKNLIEPIGSDILKDESENIKKLKKQKASTDTVESLLSLDWSLDTINRYLQGKAGVGIGALQSVNELLGQQAKWEINKNHKVTYYNPVTEKYETYDPTMKLENNNIGGAPRLWGNTTLTDPNAKDASKMRLLNNFLNAYVDIEADPFIIDINAGLDMAPTIMFMVRAGVPIRTALYFANQPIVMDMMDAFRSQQRNMIAAANDIKTSQKDIIQGVYKKYAGKDGLAPSETDLISQVTLEKYLDPDTQNMSDDTFKKDQLLILNEFLKYRSMAGELSNSLRAVNYDTKGTGGSAAVTLVRDWQMKKIKKNNFIKGYNTIFTEGNYLKEFKRAVESIPEMYKPFFPEFNKALATPAIEMQFEEYYKDMFMSFDTMVNMMDIFMNDMIHSLVMYMPLKDSTSTLTDEIRNLLVTNKETRNASSALELKRFKELFPDMARENALISRLTPIFNEEGGDRILMYDQPKEPTDIDDVIDGWRELMTSNNRNIRAFAKKLAKTSIVQFGFRNHPVGFTKYIPSEYTSELVQNAYDQYRSMGIQGQRLFKNYSMFDSIVGNDNNTDILPRKGRVALVLEYMLRPQYLGKDNEKKLESARAAGEDIWLKQLKQKTKTYDTNGELIDRMMPIFGPQGITFIPMEQYIRNYETLKGRGALKIHSDNSNRKILKGTMHTKMRGKAKSQNPLFDKAPNVKPIVEDADGKSTELKGKEAVKARKDTNGTEDTCK